jgi:acyl-CoA dehydrogenase
VHHNLEKETMQIRKAASEFASGEIAEHAQEWDAAGGVPTPAIKQAAELGFVGMTLPEKHGGMGLGLLEDCLVTEEFATASPGAATAILEPGWGGELLALQGELPSLMKERISHRVQFGLALPREGVLSSAQECADFSVTFPLVSRHAELYLIPGLFQGEEGLFYLTKEALGQGVIPLENQLGLRSWQAGRLEFRNFHLSEKCFLKCSRAVERSRQARAIRIGALSLGLARGAALLALAYARGRRIFNKSLLDLEATRAKFFKVWQRLQAARLLLYKAAGDWDRGLNVSIEAFSVEALAIVLAEETADEALQLLGGYGYFEEMKIAMFYRDAKMLDLLGEPVSSIIETVWPSLAMKTSW